MTDLDFSTVKHLYEKVCYWREIVDTLKLYQKAIKDTNNQGMYQKSFPRRGIRFRLRVKKTGKQKDNVEYIVRMNAQGLIKDVLLPLESIDVLVDWAEEQLRLEENKLSQIEVKGVDNEN